MQNGPCQVLILSGKAGNKVAPYTAEGHFIFAQVLWAVCFYEMAMEGCLDFCSVASCSFISACGFPKVVGDDRVECTGACMLCQRSQNSSALWKSSPWIVRPHIGTTFRGERRLLRPPRHHDGVCQLEDLEAGTGMVDSPKVPLTVDTQSV